MRNHRVFFVCSVNSLPSESKIHFTYFMCASYTSYRGVLVANVILVHKGGLQEIFIRSEPLS